MNLIRLEDFGRLKLFGCTAPTWLQVRGTSFNSVANISARKLIVRPLIDQNDVFVGSLSK
jgi:hypothetical protein